MIFNEIKCHVNTSFGLAEGMNPLHPSLCLRLIRALMGLLTFVVRKLWS